MAIACMALGALLVSLLNWYLDFDGISSNELSYFCVALAIGLSGCIALGSRVKVQPVFHGH